MKHTRIILSAAIILMSIGEALSLTPKANIYNILQCSTSNNTCQVSTVYDVTLSFKVGYTQIKGSSTFNSDLINANCDADNNCNQLLYALPEN